MRYEIRCGDVTGDCSIEMKADDETELAHLVQDHAKRYHDMDVSMDDAKGMLKAKTA